MGSRKPHNVLLKFMSSNDRIESVELEVNNGEHERVCNVELTIHPANATAILTSYDTPEGISVLWRSTTIFSVITILAPKVNSATNQAVELFYDNISLEMIFGSTAVSFRGDISKASFYPLGTVLKRDFVITGLLGKGGFGSVFKCSRGNMQLAIKMINKVPKGTPCSEVEAMVKLSGLDHVVQMYSAWCENVVSGQSDVYIGMEFFERNLEEYLTARTVVDLQKSTRIFTEILAGVNSIHEAGIIHRDLKPMNILIDSSDHICVTDFGIAKIKPYPAAELSYPGCSKYGTQFYCDPILNSPHHQHDEKVDIYSCGIIYFEMHLLGVTKRRSSVRKFCDKFSYSKRSRNRYDIWNSSLWQNWGGVKDIMREMVVSCRDLLYFLEKLQVTTDISEGKEEFE
ncbi:interferon-induced, double-stranded RNA-activated protein kinase-like isoform X2 [Oryza brachyantha]|uniref:interferon-induced, double-stranded RNA-activated protein kinase-like isoform X2 n=1 Tax=Oryza brachyantha TaxID=4533 RepID=UPI0007769420|nr:interferon-induced, double-stranded RNA-activated protein kinase-like isoform X2 [Oryza brachyantha]